MGLQDRGLLSVGEERCFVAFSLIVLMSRVISCSI